mmetsp:Transcript_41458/g.82015  ORF Transcript_41458/g.82015 Transcript_41458/m.82015 type:complete len:122 (+) Transcript_41458:571-936(+)
MRDWMRQTLLRPCVILGPQKRESMEVNSSFVNCTSLEKGAFCDLDGYCSNRQCLHGKTGCFDCCCSTCIESYHTMTFGNTSSVSAVHDSIHFSACLDRSLLFSRSPRESLPAWPKLLSKDQ